MSWFYTGVARGCTGCANWGPNLQGKLV